MGIPMVCRSKKIKLIGVGDDAKIKIVKDEYGMNDNHLYFKNLNFGDESLAIDDSNFLWFEECTFSDVILIEQSSNHTLSLHFKKCVFDGHMERSHALDIMVHGLDKEHNAIIEIIGCTFTNCGWIDLDNKIDIGCISFFWFKNVVCKGVSYKIYGNVFKDNPGRSVLLHDNKPEISIGAFIKSDSLTLKQNIFVGRNGKMQDNDACKLYETPDPNKVYIDQHQY